MAEIKDKRSTDRTKLETVIPLETPIELQLAVSSACNFQCVYCPIHTVASKKGVMKYELFTKIIDDLDEFPSKIKVLRLMREGEPLMNKRIGDMIRYSKKKQPTVPVDFVTNASLLTPKKSDELIDAGLDKIFISLQGMTEGAYERLGGVSVDLPTLFFQILYFCANRTHTKVFIKVPDIGVDEKEKKAFFSLFSPHVDEITVEHIFPAWPNFDVSHLQKDKNMGYYGQPKLDKVVVCTLPFYDLTLDYKGIATACSIDWEERTNFGDASKQSLYEIWNGEEFNEFRKLQLKGERFTHYLCSKCDSLEYCGPDIVDDYREELLKKYA